MFAKVSYIVVSAASLGLLLFEAPASRLLTRSPERGKVEHKANPNPGPNTLGSNNGRTVRSSYFVFIGGYHAGK